MFPTFIFCCYLALFLYFKARGGYKPVELTSVAVKSENNFAQRSEKQFTKIVE